MATKTRLTNHIAALGAAVAGLTFYTLSELAMAPTVHADPYSDIVNNLELVYTVGNELFTLGDQYLAEGDLTDALNAYFTGADNTLIAPLQNLYVDGIDVLTNTPVASAFGFDEISPSPIDFAAALTEAQTYYDIAQGDFAQAANLLSIGDFAAAELYEVIGNNALWIEVPNTLILGMFGA